MPQFLSPVLQRILASLERPERVLARIPSTKMPRELRLAKGAGEFDEGLRQSTRLQKLLESAQTHQTQSGTPVLNPDIGRGDLGALAEVLPRELVDPTLGDLPPEFVEAVSAFRRPPRVLRTKIEGDRQIPVYDEPRNEVEDLVRQLRSTLPDDVRESTDPGLLEVIRRAGTTLGPTGKFGPQGKYPRTGLIRARRAISRELEPMQSWADEQFGAEDQLSSDWQLRELPKRMRAENKEASEITKGMGVEKPLRNVYYNAKAAKAFASGTARTRAQYLKVVEEGGPDEAKLLSKPGEWVLVGREGAEVDTETPLKRTEVARKLRPSVRTQQINDLRTLQRGIVDLKAERPKLRAPEDKAELDDDLRELILSLGPAEKRIAEPNLETTAGKTDFPTPVGEKPRGYAALGIGQVVRDRDTGLVYIVQSRSNEPPLEMPLIPGKRQQRGDSDVSENFYAQQVYQDWTKVRRKADKTRATGVVHLFDPRTQRTVQIPEEKLQPLTQRGQPAMATRLSSKAAKWAEVRDKPTGKTRPVAEPVRPWEQAEGLPEIRRETDQALDFDQRAAKRGDQARDLTTRGALRSLAAKQAGKDFIGVTDPEWAKVQPREILELIGATERAKAQQVADLAPQRPEGLPARAEKPWTTMSTDKQKAFLWQEFGKLPGPKQPVDPDWPDVIQYEGQPPPGVSKFQGRYSAEDKARIAALESVQNPRRLASVKKPKKQLSRQERARILVEENKVSPEEAARIVGLAYTPPELPAGASRFTAELPVPKGMPRRGPVDVDARGYVLSAPPFLRGFVGKPVESLQRWLTSRQGALTKLAVGALAVAGAALMPEKGEAAQIKAPTIRWSDPNVAARAVKQNAPRTLRSDLQGADAALTNLVDSWSAVKAKVRKWGDERLAQELQVIGGGGMGNARDLERPILERVGALNRNEQEGLSQWLQAHAAARTLTENTDKVQRLRQDAAQAIAAGELKKGRDLQRQAAQLSSTLQRGKLTPRGSADSAQAAAQLQAIEQDITAQLGPDALTKIRTAADAVYASNRQALQRLIDAEILDPAVGQAYLQRGPYVPRTRLQGELDPITGELQRRKSLLGRQIGDSATRANRKLSVREEQIIKALEGGDPDVPYDNPVLNSLRFINDTELEVNRNYLAKRFALLGLEQEPGEFRIVTKPESSDPERGIIGFQDKGKTVYVEAPALWVDLLTMGNPQTLALGMQTMGKAKRLFQALAATANPAFAAAQVVKDIPVALARPEYNKYGQGTGPATMAEFGELWARAFREAWQDQWTPGRAEFHRGGAYLHELGQPSSAAQKLGLEKENPLYRLLNGITEAFLEPVEEATKRASFELLQNRGFGAAGNLPASSYQGWSPIPVTKLEAAYQARLYGGSPDFSQKGLWSQELGNYYMFLNPQIQGITRTASLVQNPTKLAAWMGSMTTLALISAAWNRSHQNPDTGRPEPEEWTANDKSQNITLILPEALGGGVEQLSNGRRRWKAVKIPIAHEFQALLTPIRTVIDAALGDATSDPVQGTLDTVGGFLPGNVQIDKEAPISSLLRRIGAGANPAMRLPLEFVGNQNFYTGTPIVGARTKNLPAKYQYTERTSPTAKALGSATNLSPDQIDWLVRGAAPGLGESVWGLGDLLTAPEKPELPGAPSEQLARAPIVGPFLRRFVPSLAQGQATSEDADALYKTAAAAQAAINKINNARKVDPAEAQRIFREEPELVQLAKANRILSQAVAQISEIDTIRERIQTDPTLGGSPEGRAAQLNQLSRRRQQILARMNLITQQMGLR